MVAREGGEPAGRRKEGRVRVGRGVCGMGEPEMEAAGPDVVEEVEVVVVVYGSESREHVFESSAVLDDDCDSDWSRMRREVSSANFASRILLLYGVVEKVSAVTA